MSRRLFPEYLRAVPRVDLSVTRPFLCDDCGQEVEMFEVEPADDYVEFSTTHIAFADRSLTLRLCGHTNGATVSP